ncbi:MAG: transcriptional regulator [Acidimicrobiia bacterium]|nr:transcriptional regulator [Acidimicrobiia bacterium]
MSPVRLNLLRGFELVVDGVVVDIPSSAQRVVAYLALQPRPQLRTSVASSLWIDLTDERAGANLRSALWKLRDLRDQVITARANHLSLGADVNVDVTAVVRDARDLLDDDTAHSELDLRGHDLHLLSADLLPEWDEDWILFERERIRQLRVHAIEALSRRLSRAGRHVDAIEAGLCAVAADPLRESAQRVLIEAHVAEGNLADARRQYVTFGRVLWEALGIVPSAALGRLVGISDSERGAIDQREQLR